MKKILIPNGSSSEIGLIRAAKKLGFYVITSGNNPSLIGHKYADEYCFADYSKPEELLRVAREKKIDAICPNCYDLGLLSSAYVAQEMDLPGNWDTLENAKSFSEKDKFKLMAQKLNLHTPKSEIFDNIEKGECYIKRCDFPLIVKPVDLSGGLGVQVIENESEGIAAIRNAYHLSKAKRYVIEDYLPGRQYDFHTNVVDEKVVWYSANSEFSYNNPYRVNCLIAPADHPDTISKLLVADVEKIARFLHIADGPLWLQYRIKDGVPYIIESSRRCGGNNMIDLMSRSFQYDFADYYIRLTSGLPADFPSNRLKQQKAQGYQCLMAPLNGRIRGVRISDELRSHIFQEYYWYVPGEEVENYLHINYGIILFEYDNVEEIMKIVPSINDHAKIIME